jgi:hypothetical protein
MSSRPKFKEPLRVRRPSTSSKRRDCLRGVASGRYIWCCPKSQTRAIHPIMHFLLSKILLIIAVGFEHCTMRSVSRDPSRSSSPRAWNSERLTEFEGPRYARGSFFTTCSSPLLKRPTTGELTLDSTFNSHTPVSCRLVNSDATVHPTCTRRTYLRTLRSTRSSVV